MYVNHDDLQAIASEPEGQGKSILSTMDDEVVSLKCKVCVVFINFYTFFFFFELWILMTQIQSNKQDIAQTQKKLKSDINEFRNSETTPSRVTPRWTNDEVLLAIQGMYQFNVIFQ